MVMVPGRVRELAGQSLGGPQPQSFRAESGQPGFFDPCGVPFCGAPDHFGRYKTGQLVALLFKSPSEKEGKKTVQPVSYWNSARIEVGDPSAPFEGVPFDDPVLHANLQSVVVCVLANLMWS